MPLLLLLLPLYLASNQTYLIPYFFSFTLYYVYATTTATAITTYGPRMTRHGDTYIRSTYIYACMHALSTNWLNAVASLKVG